jgi:hypothetical protein
MRKRKEKETNPQAGNKDSVRRNREVLHVTVLYHVFDHVLSRSGILVSMGRLDASPSRIGIQGKGKGIPLGSLTCHP